MEPHPETLFYARASNKTKHCTTSRVRTTLPDVISFHEAPVMLLPDLPWDIHILITEYLAAEDIWGCWRVSRAWKDAFTDPHLLWRCLVRCFPYASEVRDSRRPLNDPRKHAIAHASFKRVVRRYHHLRKGRPSRIESIAMGRLPQLSAPVANLSIMGRRVIFNVGLHYDESWTLSDGLLVYLDVSAKALVSYDLDLGEKRRIPMDLDGKLLRRVRLRHDLLVVEWAEATAFHQLNDSEVAHRHFATFFDVTREHEANDSTPAVASSPFPWTVQFRTEIKLHFLGLPLNGRDRFVTTHSSESYAVYVWQPNRSMWAGGEEEPIESLVIWDISQPSDYRPSEDPSGVRRLEAESLPTVIRRLSFTDLGFYGVRQGSEPRLRRLAIDDQMVYFHGENVESRRGNTNIRVPTETVTGIPLSCGPAWTHKKVGKETFDLDPGFWDGLTANAPRKALALRTMKFPDILSPYVSLNPKCRIAYCLSIELRAVAVPVIDIRGDGWKSELSPDYAGELWKQVNDERIPRSIHGDDRYLVMQMEPEKLEVMSWG